jgi:hypothetical protein
LTADAQTYLANLTPQQRTDLTALAAQVDAMTKKNRDLLVQSGLETQETVDNWENAYKNYIPLARAEADYELKNIGKGVGQGVATSGPASRRAIGSHGMLLTSWQTLPCSASARLFEQRSYG